MLFHGFLFISSWVSHEGQETLYLLQHGICRGLHFATGPQGCEDLSKLPTDGPFCLNSKHMSLVVNLHLEND